MEEFGRFVANVGVPAAIAFYALWKVSTTLDRLRETIAENTRVLAVLVERIGWTEQDGDRRRPPQRPGG